MRFSYPPCIAFFVCVPRRSNIVVYLLLCYYRYQCQLFLDIYHESVQQELKRFVLCAVPRVRRSTKRSVDGAGVQITAAAASGGGACAAGAQLSGAGVDDDAVSAVMSPPKSIRSS